ncbi:hypothetical protein AB0B52_29785 [Streptomyces griseofuscus]|uniref:hypothetical protein n=1 Tax=Streptomyces griseofuscus TaxID=146922 RepID=UPI0033F422E5
MTAYIPAGAPRATESRMTFQLRTTPEPVRISPGTGDAEYATLTVIGSVVGEGEVTLGEVTVKVLAGADAPHFASSLGGVEAFVDRAGWIYTGVQQSTFSFMPSTGGETVQPGASVPLTLHRIPVNQVTGSSQVTVTAYGNDGSPTGQSVFEVAKFPPGFYVKDFAASPPHVPNGEDVELRWQASSGATLRLLYEDQQYDVTGRSEFTVRDMRRTTVFYLRAAHGTAEQTLGTVVGVPDPDLEVNNLVTSVVRTDRLETLTLDRIRIVAPPAPDPDWDPDEEPDGHPAGDRDSDPDAAAGPSAVTFSAPGSGEA